MVALPPSFLLDWLRDALPKCLATVVFGYVVPDPLTDEAIGELGDVKMAALVANVNLCLIGAARGGQGGMITEMLGHGATHMGEAAYLACLHGHAEVAELLTTGRFQPRERMASALFYEGVPCDNFIEGACEGGHDELLNKFDVDRHGEASLGAGLYGACKGRHTRLVRKMIAFGATDWELGLLGAAEGGDLSIVTLMAERCQDVISWNEVLRAACLGGHRAAVDYAIDQGAHIFCDGLLAAWMGKKMDIMTLMIKRGASDFGQCIKHSASIGDADGVAMMIGQIPAGGRELDVALDAACASGHHLAVRLLLAAGARNYSLTGQKLTMDVMWELVECRGALSAPNRLRFACKIGDVALAQRVIAEDSPTVAMVIAEACAVGNVEVARMAMSSPADAEECAVIAGRMDRPDILAAAIELGARTRIPEMMIDACKAGRAEIARVIMEAAVLPSYDVPRAIARQHNNLKIAQLLDACIGPKLPTMKRRVRGAT